MTSSGLNVELPWSSSVSDDARFNKIVGASLALLVMLSLVATLVKVPDIARAEKEKLPPQLARVILEKKVLPPPVEQPKLEPPKVEAPKPEPKPVETKVEPVPQVKPPPVQPKEQAAPSQEAITRAREQAAATGVMQFKDDLAEMRQMMDTAAVAAAETTRAEAAPEAAAPDRTRLTSAAKSTSGGINTADLSRDTGAAGLAGRETTQVTSNLGKAASTTAAATTAPSASGSEGAERSKEEIRKVMEQHKGAIYSIYNRALRQNAALEGKMVVRIVIDTSGKITEVTLVSSELGDSDLESKILQRIRLISFPASRAARTTLNQTFDFLP